MHRVGAKQLVLSVCLGQHVVIPKTTAENFLTLPVRHSPLDKMTNYCADPLDVLAGRQFQYKLRQKAGYDSCFARMQATICNLIFSCVYSTLSIRYPIMVNRQRCSHHLERSSFFYLSAVRTQCSAFLPLFCTRLHQRRLLPSRTESTLRVNHLEMSSTLLYSHVKIIAGSNCPVYRNI